MSEDELDAVGVLDWVLDGLRLFESRVLSGAFDMTTRRHLPVFDDHARAVGVVLDLLSWVRLCEPPHHRVGYRKFWEPPNKSPYLLRTLDFGRELLMTLRGAICRMIYGSATEVTSLGMVVGHYEWKSKPPSDHGLEERAWTLRDALKLLGDEICHEGMSQFPEEFCWDHVPAWDGVPEVGEDYTACKTCGRSHPGMLEGRTATGAEFYEECNCDRCVYARAEAEAGGYAARR